MKVSLIIPFKNEREYAELTLQAVHAHMLQHSYDYEIIVVDDSTDGTWELLQNAARAHAHVTLVKGDQPPGYGKALRKGFAHASGDILIPFNGDLCDSLEDVSSYIRLIEDGYEVVFGSRYMDGGKILDHPSFKVLLSRTGNAFFNVLFNARCSDITNTFKAFRAHVVKEIKPVSNGYDLGIELALKSIVRGYRYTTIPVTWSARQYGQSKMSVLKSLFVHLKTGLAIRFTYR